MGEYKLVKVRLIKTGDISPIDKQLANFIRYTRYITGVSIDELSVFEAVNLWFSQIFR